MWAFCLFLSLTFFKSYKRDPFSLSIDTYIHIHTNFNLDILTNLLKYENRVGLVNSCVGLVNI